MNNGNHLLRLLLVEDNPGDVRLIEAMLQETAAREFSLECVDRLAAGLERLGHKKSDVVLLDLSLPDSHGLDTFLTMHSYAPHVPVIVLTGAKDDELALQAVQEGAQDYLIKGEIDGKLLMRAVRYGLERHRIEEELRQSEERYRTFFEQSQDAVYIVDREGRWIDVNQSLLDLFGYSAEEIAELGADTFWADRRERERFRAAIEADGSVAEVPVKYRKKNGTVIECLETSTVRRDGGERFVGYQGIIRDVTERNELERQLLQAQKIEAVGQLAGGVAHDFNNILTGITGYAQLALQQLEEDSGTAADLRKVLEVAERAHKLTAQLLAFSHRQTLQEKVLNLNRLVTDSLKMIQRLVSEDIEISFLPGKELGNIRADAVQAEQIILNLVINARDAMPDGGELTIATSRRRFAAAGHDLPATLDPGEYVVVSVSDNGVGMDEGTQARIFEPFFTTKEVGKGTGLGLATVEGIVTQHGGAIRVRSAPGEGTTFDVFLPVVEEEADPVAVAEPKADLEGSEIILLVEDEELVRSVTTRGLKLFGYTVLVAATPSQALSLIGGGRGTTIDLLITDVVMPEMNGPLLYEEIQRQVGEMKVLYVSGYADKRILKTKVLDAGAPFLPKPFGITELAHKVREVLDR
jgi:PAS domain S-box-containing protein